DIYYGIRDKTRAIADQHANLGRTVEGSIVQHLQKLRVEIKAHIKNIQNDTGKLATSVAKERALSAKLVGDLATNIAVLKNTPLGVTARSDPYVSNQVVARQLVRQVHTENALHKSLLLTQSSSALFEASLVQAVQSAWATFEEWRARTDSAIRDTWGVLSREMAALPTDREWIAFAAREDHLVDPETPLRDPQHIQYPSKDDPSVLPVHAGLLERKKRYTRSYREAFYVLTPAGFLHEFASSDPALADRPQFSLFLPLCTLGPPSAPSAKSHKFHIEERKDGTGGVHTGSLRGLRSSLTGGGGRAWAFRGRSHEDMMEWWNDIRMLCARYLVASEQMERSGPVAAAVVPLVI
ncbi:Cytoskeletal signaling protein slm1, partial [Grifola frondosa]